MPKRIAIVGGGASGVLLARHLLENSGDVSVSIIEPNRLGLGVAYSTPHRSHLLNVPAGRMSALAEDPEHFLRWLASNGHGYGAGSFVPRYIYGEYLSEIARGFSKHAGRFVHVPHRALTAEAGGSALRITCNDERSYEADILVLATGNAVPAKWRNAPRSSRFHESAWSEEALLPRDPFETVLVLGTGLTAVDAVLGLRENGHRGTIHLLSRRALLPHEHRIVEASPVDPPEVKTLRELVRKTRVHSSRNWRSTVDSLRPLTNETWAGFTLVERRRFMRHLSAYWNVHRHRMAQPAAKAVAELLCAGTLRVCAGTATAFEEKSDVLRVQVRDRGGATSSLVAHRVINCSGPDHDITRSSNPLIESLLMQGLITPSALSIGVSASADGALIDANGAVSQRLFAIGPVRFGTLIETTAIPEIREQAAELSRRLRVQPSSADRCCHEDDSAFHPRPFANR